MSSHWPGKHDVNPVTLSFGSAVVAPASEDSEKAARPTPLYAAFGLLAFILLLSFVGLYTHS